MPDGDNLHPTLSRRYQQAYDKLFQSALSDDDLAADLMQRLKKDVVDFHKVTQPFLMEVAAHLVAVPPMDLFNSVLPWQQEQEAIRALFEKTREGRYVCGLALQAAIIVLSHLESGGLQDKSTLLCLLNKQYLDRLYKARFEDHVPTLSVHNDGMDVAGLEVRLKAVRPEVDRHIAFFAGQLARLPGHEKPRLRLAPRLRPPLDNIESPALSILPAGHNFRPGPNLKFRPTGG